MNHNHNCRITIWILCCKNSALCHVLPAAGGLCGWRLGYVSLWPCGPASKRQSIGRSPDCGRPCWCGAAAILSERDHERVFTILKQRCLPSSELSTCETQAILSLLLQLRDVARTLNWCTRSWACWTDSTRFTHGQITQLVYDHRGLETFDEHLPVYPGDRWSINIGAQTILSWTCRSVCWANLGLMTQWWTHWWCSWSSLSELRTSRDNNRYCNLSNPVPATLFNANHLFHNQKVTDLRFLSHRNLSWKWMVPTTHTHTHTQ